MHRSYLFRGHAFSEPVFPCFLSSLKTVNHCLNALVVIYFAAVESTGARNALDDNLSGSKILLNCQKYQNNQLSDRIVVAPSLIERSHFQEE